MLRVGFLVLGLALFIYLILDLGPAEIGVLLQRIGWDFLVICLIYGAYILLRARALFECMLDREGLTYPRVLLIYVSGETVKNLTFGGAFFSEPFKAVLLSRRGPSREGSVAAALTEFLANTLVSTALSLIGLILLLEWIELREPFDSAVKTAIGGSGVFLLLSLLAGWWQFRPFSWLRRMAVQVPGMSPRFLPDPGGIRRVEDVLFHLLGGASRRSWKLLTIETVAQGVLILELYWILHTLQLSFPALYPFLIESVAKLIRVAFFFVPLQVGASEGVMTVVFESMGLISAAGFTFSLVRRLRSLVVSALGLISGWYSTGR